MLSRSDEIERTPHRSLEARTRNPTIALSVLVTLSILRQGSAAEAIVEEETRGVEGLVSLSSGEVLRGRVSLTEGTKLRVYDLQARRIHELRLEDLDSIRTLIESEAIEEAWTFEEGGSRTKLKLGWTYPIRSFRQEVQLAGGEVIEGHCHAAVLWMEIEGEDRKIILPRQAKGTRGQALEDLVYPVSVQFARARGKTAVGTAPKGRLASLSGRAPGMQALVVFDPKSLRGIPARVSKDGAFRVEGLVPGTYALFWRRAGEWSLGLDATKPDLSPEDLKSIRSRIATLAEFFPERRIVDVAGSRVEPWCLVELDRVGGTTLTDPAGKSWSFRRWELWAFEREGADWRIQSRVFLDRAAVAPGQALPAIESVRRPAFAEWKVRSGENEVALDR